MCIPGTGCTSSEHAGQLALYIKLAESGSSDCSGSNMEQPGIKLKNGFVDQGVDDLPVALFHPNTQLLLYKV